MGFGWRELHRGNRFWAPVSESALLEAGRWAGLIGGMSLLEEACGNGAAALFFSEEFHVYVRGLEGAGDALSEAQQLARRSPAARRAKFFRDAAAQRYGPVDVLCSLRRPSGEAAALVRPGGRIVWGRYLAPQGAGFPPSDPPTGAVIWSRTASPLEWERFLAPQERALRSYRRALRGPAKESRIAAIAQRQIDAFRAQGARIAYELSVTEVSG